MILSGSSMWSPLASVIAFGLLGSMVFTLVAIPVLFVVAHRERKPHGNGGNSGLGSWFPRSQKRDLHPTDQDQSAGTPNLGHPAALLLLALFALGGVARAETRRITLDEAVALATGQSSTAKLAHLKAKEIDRGAGQLLSGAEQRKRRRSPAQH
jgi:hypothetical protein